MSERKEWGESRQVIDNPLCQAYRIHVEPGGFCSWHKHVGKWNAFTVVKGYMVVEEERESPVLDQPYTHATMLLPGTVYAVAPGVKHRFTTEREGAEAIEWYWPGSLVHDDIIRYAPGGINDCA